MAGFEVEVAENSQEVLQKIREGKFDLAILDLTVPGGMGGKELLPFLKSFSPDLKTILMSGYPLEDQKIGDFDAFLKKPFTIPELYNVIQKLLHA